MKHLIKNKKLVVSLNTKGNTTEFVIKKHNPASHLGITRLGDVLKALPFGIIYKEETGMGATTLELETPRNSIIVEPIKITASSKAYKHSVSDDKKVLYVGSETKFHKKGVTKKEISQYVNNAKIKYKKIIVVADSLHKVIEAIDLDDLFNYHLMIDEADSFQMDSLYRKSMDNCIEVYQMWPNSNRCMVSATVLDFSDPELKKEHFTKISYDTHSARHINIINTYTQNVNAVAFDLIKECINKNPNNKILVAYNSVTNIYDIAESLKKENIFNERDIAILCSKSSKEKVGNYYRELDSEALPSKINFLTSAYFTGFDLNEQYHLITVFSNGNLAHVLSDKKIKQIAGRCRVGLLSETIIHDSILEPNKISLIKKEELIEASNVELDALKCLNQHFKKNKQLKELHNIVSESILNVLEENNNRYIKKRFKSEEYSISYLNIDAALENNRTQYNIYRKPENLCKILQSQGHKIRFTHATSNTLVESNMIEQSNRLRLVQDIISLIRTNGSNLLDSGIEINRLSPIQKKIVDIYTTYSFYFDNDTLINLIEEKANSRDLRGLNNLESSLNYSSLPTGNIYKSRVEYYFPINARLKPDVILTNWKKILNEMPFNNKEIDSTTEAVRLLNIHFKCKRKRDGSYLIENNNPHNIKLINTRRDPSDFDYINYIL